MAPALLTELGIKPGNEADSLLKALNLLYLADWKSALDTERQLTSIKWRKAAWGPYSKDAIMAIAGRIRYQRLLAHSQPIKDDLRQAVRRWSAHNADNLRKLVDSTYPMMVGGAGVLNLPELAAKYRDDFLSTRLKEYA